MFFIKVTDAMTGNEMVIRGDLIFKIEEFTDTITSNKIRLITFTNQETEYVKDTIEELIMGLLED